MSIFLEDSLKDILAYHKQQIAEEKRRLGVTADSEVQAQSSVPQCNNREATTEPEAEAETVVVVETSSDGNGLFRNENEGKCDENKENLNIVVPKNNEIPFIVEPLDLRELKKEEFIDRLSKEEYPFTSSTRSTQAESNCKMLRYGEFSPNNPQVRSMNSAPYLGLGEYEQRRQYLHQRHSDYLHTLPKQSELVKNTGTPVVEMRRPSGVTPTGINKAVQTDIKNIHSKIVQYELHTQSMAEKELSPLPVRSVMDQRLTSAQNELVSKPKSILVKSPRERHLADLQHSYLPSVLDGSSYGESYIDRIRRENEERTRKHEIYKEELRLQIEEKKRLSVMREEQDRRQQEIEARRLELQLKRMQEENERQEERRQRRIDQLQRTNDDYFRLQEDLQTKVGQNIRRRRGSETSLSRSPPISLVRSYLNNEAFPSTSYRSLTSPRPSRHSSCTRFDDSTIPVLKTRSPTAKDLKNSVAINSARHSETRRLEDKWQVPVVRKNVVTHVDHQVDPFAADNQGRSILTQLGAIRLQLQQEQLRMDETLRKRGTMQRKSIQ